MFGYDFNFNNIQKRIAVADLTGEQIQELFNLLQTKKSEKPELTKEEKAFFQCCREHRSYVNDKDLETVVCPNCGSVKGCQVRETQRQTEIYVQGLQQHFRR